MNRTTSFISAAISFAAIFIAPYLVNHGLTIDAPTVESVMVALVGIAAFLWTAWKNHNITAAAMEAQCIMEELKADLGEDCEGKEE